MPTSNCQFKGSGGQYFGTVIIHLFILSAITFGIYSAWAWVRIFRLKASHTTMNGKTLSFTGTGGQLFILGLIQGLLTIVTLGLYFPWALCKFFSWKAQNTLVGGRPSQFSGTGRALFVFYLIHLFILPLLTLGLYYFLGVFRLYAWKEEHTKYGGEKTSFGASFGGFFKVSLLSYLLNIITLSLFTPWAMCMLFKWQIDGLAVGDSKDVEHYPQVKTNIIFLVVLIIIGLIPFLAVAFLIKGQLGQFQKIKSQIGTAQMKGFPAPSILSGKKQTLKIHRRPSKQISRPRSKAKPVQKKGVIVYDSEMKNLNALIGKNKTNADAFYDRGWLYESKGNYRKAEEDYTRAVEINKDHADAYYNRGLVLVKIKKYEQAIKDFSEAIRLNPRSVDGYCNRGNAYLRLGKTDSALQDYNAALKINPKDTDILFNRAVVYLTTGKKEEAMSDIRKAAEWGHKKAKEYLAESSIKPKSLLIKPEASREGEKDTGNLIVHATTVLGKIHGQKFRVKEVKLQNNILTLSQGANVSVGIFFFLKEGENLQGKTFNISKEDGFGVPHIIIEWQEGKMKKTTRKTFMKGYTMRLQFGKMDEAGLPGKIDVSLPDESGSFVKGTFIAKLK